MGQSWGKAKGSVFPMVETFIGHLYKWLVLLYSAAVLGGVFSLCHGFSLYANGSHSPPYFPATLDSRQPSSCPTQKKLPHKQAGRGWNGCCILVFIVTRYFADSRPAHKFILQTHFSSETRNTETSIFPSWDLHYPRWRNTPPFSVMHTYNCR